MWQQDLVEQPFTREERRFLTCAGRAHVPIDVLMEKVEAIVGPERPARGRQSFLATRLIEDRLFTDREEALAFADAYYLLAKQGRISAHLLWDWE